ncbi:hypothetical protein [Sphingobacterium sp. SGL-16]|uniref:hypothetical protein n=1 Tax=Sphingobacterium sp. SGL-16 TaxID=2710883 RepID=UPI0013EA6BD2|nr:hypothetical protein [Sphingobacterium sp. SGL-16]NGM72825.1 hypothetical protein [Sphingobacterium sp. SGL-16]
MNRLSKTHRASIDLLLNHWSRFIAIQPYHKTWLYQHSSFSTYIRGNCIYDSNWGNKKLFYVCKGLLGHVDYYIDKKTGKEKRTILSIGLPLMSMMTTDHLYSNTQGPGQIIALRPSQVLIFSYEKIKNFIREDYSLAVLLSAMLNKKKRQLGRLRQVDAVHDPQTAYIRFTNNLPELVNLLSQTEQQDLLGISRSTIRRVSFFLLTGKHTR